MKGGFFLLFNVLLTPNSVAFRCESDDLTMDSVPPCNPLCTPEHSVQITTPKVVEIHFAPVKVYKHKILKI